MLLFFSHILIKYSLFSGYATYFFRIVSEVKLLNFSISLSKPCCNVVSFYVLSDLARGLLHPGGPFVLRDLVYFQVCSINLHEMSH